MLLAAAVSSKAGRPHPKNTPGLRSCRRAATQHPETLAARQALAVLRQTYSELAWVAKLWIARDRWAAPMFPAMAYPILFSVADRPSLPLSQSRILSHNFPQPGIIL